VAIWHINPQVKLDVSGSLANLYYRKAYLGFNAIRNNGSWTFAEDGANNGGGVIWTTVRGSILDASETYMVPQNG